MNIVVSPAEFTYRELIDLAGNAFHGGSVAAIMVAALSILSQVDWIGS